MMLLWLSVLVIELLLPHPALAWGPITHLAHGSGVLQTLNTLGVGLQELLARYPLEYLYGCIGADITQAKKYTGALAAHCHSWLVGWQLRDAADTDAERAFAYGYLSHLAADVYSHNHFVPTQLIVSYPARTLRHTYWETRCDSLQSSELRGLIQDLRRRPFPECDALVERVVARTLFSFRTNKRIFDSMIAWQGFEPWHRVMLTVDARSRYLLPTGVVTRYNQLCQASILDTLTKGKRASSQANDPTGHQALTQAMAIRHTLRSLRREGLISAALAHDIAAMELRADVLEEAVRATLTGRRVRRRGATHDAGVAHPTPP